MTIKKTPFLNMNDFSGADDVDYLEINDNFKKIDDKFKDSDTTLNSLAVPIERFGAVGGGLVDDTQAFVEALEQSPEGTTFLLSKKYLVNNVWGSAKPGLKGISFIGRDTAEIKIKPNILSVVNHGTITGLNYSVRDYNEEFATSTMGWKVENIQLHTGKIFQFIKVPVKTTIPATLVTGVNLRGALSRLQFEVASVDMDDPDGVGTARIYFFGAMNNETSSNTLDLGVDDITLAENLQVKPYLQRDSWMINLGTGVLNPAFVANRKITQVLSGKVARIVEVRTYTDKDGIVTNILEVASFAPSQYAKAYQSRMVPLNINESLKVEEFDCGPMSFMALNKCEDMSFEDIKFDGSNYEVGRIEMDANDWNIIYSDSVRGLRVKGCSFKHSVMAGLHIGGANNPSSIYSDYPDRVVIDDCFFEDNGRNDIEIIHGKNIHISNCHGDNSLDVEMNGNEIVESVTITDSSFYLFSPFSPSPISNTCEVSVVNSRFNRASAVVGAMAKMTNCFMHSVGVYNANSIEFNQCTINKIDGQYGESIPTFNNCQIYGLPNDGSGSYNDGDRSMMKLNNSIIDLSFSEKVIWHGSWGFDFRDSVIISKTHVVTIQKIFINEPSFFHDTEFNNVILENGSSAKDMKFYNCQLLAKDPLDLYTGLKGWSSEANLYLENCYLQVGISHESAATLVDCVLDGVTKPEIFSRLGTTINGLKSNLPQGIDWDYLETSNSAKVKFNNVHVSKTISEFLGTFGFPAVTTVADGSTVLYMDDTERFSSVIYYELDGTLQPTILAVKSSVGGSGKLVVESVTADPTGALIGQLWLRSDL